MQQEMARLDAEPGRSIPLERPGSPSDLATGGSRRNLLGLPEADKKIPLSAPVEVDQKPSVSAPLVRASSPLKSPPVDPQFVPVSPRFADGREKGRDYLCCFRCCSFGCYKDVPESAAEAQFQAATGKAVADLRVDRNAFDPPLPSPGDQPYFGALGSHSSSEQLLEPNQKGLVKKSGKEHRRTSSGTASVGDVKMHVGADEVVSLAASSTVKREDYI